MSKDQTEIPQPLTNQWFATTHWTVVLAAKGPDSNDADAALERLCQTYWGALYAYIRRSGRPPADAADLTQAFFARLLEKRFLNEVDRDKGKFRSLLLKSLNNFLIDNWRHQETQKRGGGGRVLSMNSDEWEQEFAHELAADTTPEKLFDRRWAIALIDKAMKRLRDEAVQKGKDQDFELLKNFLSCPSRDGTYASVATQLGLSQGAVAVEVHRLRKRYGQLVREEIAQTVLNLEDVEQELQYLLAILTE